MADRRHRRAILSNFGRRRAHKWPGDDPGHEELRKREQIGEVDRPETRFSMNGARVTDQHRQRKIIDDEEDHRRHDEAAFGLKRFRNRSLAAIVSQFTSAPFFVRGPFVRRLRHGVAKWRNIRRRTDNWGWIFRNARIGRHALFLSFAKKLAQARSSRNVLLRDRLSFRPHFCHSERSEEPRESPPAVTWSRLPKAVRVPNE